MSTQTTPPSDAPPPPDPPWIVIARRELGVAELPGAADNPRIIEYLKATRLPPSMWHDSTAHCAAFVSWVLLEAKLPSPRTASARAYMEYGQRLTEPRVGAITVFSRGPNPAHGHVAFFIGLEVAETGVVQNILVLGANQRNQVRVAPYAAARLLGYRWPAGVPLVG